MWTWVGQTPGVPLELEHFRFSGHWPSPHIAYLRARIAGQKRSVAGKRGQRAVLCDSTATHAILYPKLPDSAHLAPNGRGFGFPRPVASR